MMSHEKFWISSFFIYFFLKWEGTFEKLQFASFGPKQRFYLTHSSQEYFEKLTFKRNKKRKFKRFYLKSSDNFRFQKNIFTKLIQFSLKEGSFFHALPILVHGRGICPLQPLVPLPAATHVQRLNDEPRKVLNFLFSYLFLLQMRRNFWRTRICPFWTEAMFLINPF